MYAGLEVALGFQPIYLRARTEARLTAIRIKPLVHPDWDGLRSRGKKGHLLLSDTGGRNPSDRVVDMTGTHYCAPVDFDSFEDGTQTESDSDSNMAFSDGCIRRDGAGGFGVIVLKKGHQPTSESGALGYRSEVKQAETYAIMIAASKLLELKVEEQVTIYSDSKQVLSALARPCLLYTSDAADE